MAETGEGTGPADTGSLRCPAALLGGGDGAACPHLHGSASQRVCQVATPLPPAPEAALGAGGPEHWVSAPSPAKPPLHALRTRRSTACGAAPRPPCAACRRSSPVPPRRSSARPVNWEPGNPPPGRSRSVRAAGWRGSRTAVRGRRRWQRPCRDGRGSARTARTDGRGNGPRPRLSGRR